MPRRGGGRGYLPRVTTPGVSVTGRCTRPWSIREVVASDRSPAPGVCWTVGPLLYVNPPGTRVCCHTPFSKVLGAYVNPPSARVCCPTPFSKVLGGRGHSVGSGPPELSSAVSESSKMQPLP
jgi:hypothetical protein